MKNILLFFFIAIILLVCIVSFYITKNKIREKNFLILEVRPALETYDIDQHLRRLNKYRTSNYKGIVYYLSKKGGHYYYSKNNVRIYI